MAGRTTKYNDAAPIILNRIAEGATFKEAYTEAGINKDTFFDWKKNNSEFSDLIKKAQEEFRQTIVSKLEKGLYKRALGYKITETRTEYAAGPGGNPIIVKQTKTEKEFAPDTAALIFSLSNLEPNKWQNKQFQEVSGNIGGVKIVVNNEKEANMIDEMMKKL